ncbi:MAG TPA: hypothetical protein PLO20_16125 [Thermogutta sp.]|nr:hypothetical protein [Thermogutta sp.]HQF14290.1 hypothetical protein [Thermogutta sp.]
MKAQVLFLCILVGLAVLGWGCSKERKVSFKAFPVKVTITYHGRPLEGADVRLHPLDPNGRGAQGKTDASGVATMRSFGEGGAMAEGAMAGKYKVLVSKSVSEVEIPATPEGPDYDRMAAQEARADPYASSSKPLLPLKYSSWEQSPFECEVTEAGPNEFTFDIPD